MPLKDVLLLISCNIGVQEQRLTDLALTADGVSAALNHHMQIGERLLTQAERARSLETESEKVFLSSWSLPPGA